jgi:hypothetical protein
MFWVSAWTSHASAPLSIFIHSGYHAIGPDVTLAAILPSRVVDLTSTNLSWRSQRIRSFVYIIKLCSVIVALRNVIGARHTSELVPLARE